jgi:DNA-binding transcriptional MerR regulator
MGVHANTLRRWQLSHEGPPTLTIGKRRYYTREIIEQWIRARALSSQTS